MTDFTPELPDHECTGDDTCPYPATLRIQATASTDTEGGAEFQMEIHGYSTMELAELLVKLFDTVVAENAGPEVPPVVSHSRAREYLMQAAESVPTSLLASLNVQDLLQMFTEQAQNKTEDE
jgi:hypothetical protein